MTLQSIQGAIAWPPMTYGFGDFGMTANVVVDAAGEGHGIVFMAPATGNIAKIGWRTHTVTTGGDMDVRLETVDDTSGLPDGNLKAASANVVITVDATDDLTLFESTLTSAAAVTKGDVLAAIIVGDTGFASTLQLSGPESVVVEGRYSTTYLPYGVVHTGSWAKDTINRCTLWIEYDDGVCYPVGFSGVASETSFSSASTPDEVGIKFQVPFPCRVTGFWVSAEIDGDATIKLYGPSTITAALDKDIRVAAAGHLHQGFFASTVDLVKDTDYRLTLLPGATSIKRHETTLFDANARGAASGGTNVAKTSRADAGGWTEDTTMIVQIGLLIDQLDDGVGGGTTSILGGGNLAGGFA
ncbi:MAG: hypothetical protein V3V96_10665 [Acidiferrobacterales bacterium]